MTFNIEIYLLPLVINLEDCIKFMREKGLLRKFLYCYNCSIVFNEVMYKLSIDGLAFSAIKTNAKIFLIMYRYVNIVFLWL